MADSAAAKPIVPESFLKLVGEITARLDGKAVEPELKSFLDAEFPATGEWFVAMERACNQGVVEGWLCAREQGGIKFGRPVKPDAESQGFSVDVVEMDNIIGPHHIHPNGEIDMVMPIDRDALFDGAPRGWKVYGAGSAHNPTVSGGKALVLYLLPGGAIQFT